MKSKREMAKEFIMREIERKQRDVHKYKTATVEEGYLAGFDKAIGEALKTLGNHFGVTDPEVHDSLIFEAIRKLGEG